MRKMLLLGVGTICLLTSALVPSVVFAQAELEVPEVTCRAVLDGFDFKEVSRREGLSCCYVKEETPWYLDNDVYLNRYYERDDLITYFTKTCEAPVDPGTTGSIVENPRSGDDPAPDNGPDPGTDPGPGDPGNGDEDPGNGHEDPGNGHEDPGNGDEDPGNGDEDPCNGHEDPGKGEECPDDGDDHEDDDDQAGNPGNDLPVGHAGESPGPGEFGDGIKGVSQ